jgi:ElaA protein
MTRSAWDRAPVAATIRSATFAELDAATLYAILQLRSNVFVVEQRCAYRDLDGRDTEPGARHIWITDGRSVHAYVRTLDEGGGVTRIGRVVTVPQQRGRGLADRLVRHAVASAPGVVVAAAQADLTGWYERRGFVVDGARFLDGGIPHVPMRRDPDDVGSSR